MEEDFIYFGNCIPSPIIYFQFSNQQIQGKRKSKWS